MTWATIRRNALVSIPLGAGTAFYIGLGNANGWLPGSEGPTLISILMVILILAAWMLFIFGVVFPIVVSFLSDIGTFDGCEQAKYAGLHLILHVFEIYDWKTR